MANERKILGALGHAGTVYRKGMETELFDAAKRDGLDLGPFVDAKVLSGEWGHSAGRATALPEGFPSKDLLEQTGFGSLEKLKAASDDELLAIDGIGAKTLSKIREAVE